MAHPTTTLIRAARRAPMILLCLAFAGCAATRPLPAPSARTQPPPAMEPQTRPPVARPAVPTANERRAPADAGVRTALPEPAPRADDRVVVASASVALLEQGRSERAAGSYAAAAASIERALRIEPNNAELWLELGEIKLADGDPQQAQMMARKALTFAGSDPQAAARAERLIDRAAACTGGGC